MAFTDKETLEDFSLKSNHLAKMTGVSIAAHAIADSYMLMHSGVGCKYKAAAQIARHDWVDHPNRKEGWTEVAEGHLIAGSSQRIGPYARQWWERRKFGYLVVASAYFIELTGEDIRSAVEDLEATIPAPAGAFNTAAPNGGLFDGYMDVMMDIVRRQPWSDAPKRPAAVATAGFFFHRYEADQKSDLAILRQLYKAAGLEEGPILFSGQPYAELATAHECGRVVTLPYIATHKKKLDRQLKKRQVIPLDLPIGLAGTSRFLRELTAATGGNLARVDAFLAKQMEVTSPGVRQMAGFRGLRIALCADTPLAAGLCSLLREMGLDLAWVGLRDDVLGGPEALHRVLEKNGAPLNADAVVVANPSLRKVRSEVLDRIDRDEVHIVIGSSIDLELFSWVRSTRGMDRWVPLIETGFPSVHQHASVPMPTLGFAGATSWVQRITDALMQARVGVGQRLH